MKFVSMIFIRIIYVKENKRIGTPGEFQTVSPPGEQKPKAGQPRVTKQ